MAAIIRESNSESGFKVFGAGNLRAPIELSADVFVLRPRNFTLISNGTIPMSVALFAPRSNLRRAGRGRRVRSAASAADHEKQTAALVWRLSVNEWPRRT